MLNPYRRALDRVVNIDDFRQLASRRLPRAIFDYIDGGADGEVTLRDNRRAWDEVFFRPRNAVRVGQVDMRTSVLGSDLECPLFLAPLGYGRLFHPDAEVGAARAARQAGVGYVLSTFSGCRVEDVVSAGGPVWYQLYLAGGRDVAETTIRRAWGAGCKALAVTIDTNAPGMRERDIRNGAAAL